MIVVRLEQILQMELLHVTLYHALSSRSAKCPKKIVYITIYLYLLSRLTDTGVTTNFYLILALKKLLLGNVRLCSRPPL